MCLNTLLELIFTKFNDTRTGSSHRVIFLQVRKWVKSLTQFHICCTTPAPMIAHVQTISIDRSYLKYDLRSQQESDLCTFIAFVQN